MIREVARCPYCGQVSAGVDDDIPDLVIAPDCAGGRPCDHLAFLCVTMQAYWPKTGRLVTRGSGQWLWVRGEGTRALPVDPYDPGDPLADYVVDVTRGTLAGEAPPSAEYRVGGATAGQREADRPGSGEFLLPRRGRRAVAAYLDGHGLYSPDPDALVDQVRRLAGGDGC